MRLDIIRCRAKCLPRRRARSPNGCPCCVISPTLDAPLSCLSPGSWVLASVWSSLSSSGTCRWSWWLETISLEWIWFSFVSIVSIVVWFQDYGGTSTVFGMASVVNHISEMLAYFLSYPLIRKIGHIKVIKYKWIILSGWWFSAFYFPRPGVVFGFALQRLAFPLHFLHPRTLGRHSIRIDSRCDSLGRLGRRLLLHRPQYSTGIARFRSRSFVFYSQRSWTRLRNHFRWTLFHLLR